MIRRLVALLRPGWASDRGSGRQRRGFTLVEVLLVSAVMSIVARIAIPNVNHVLTKARAADVVGHIAVLRTAAYNYQADHLDFPPETPAGEVPEGLAEYLPEGFDMQGERYTLDWESWTLADGLPTRPDVNEVAGVTVIPEDAALADALRAVVGSSGWFMLQGNVTFIVAAD